MIKIEGNTLTFRYDAEIMQIVPWGENAFRIRATHNSSFLPDDSVKSALTESVEAYEITKEEFEYGVKITNGKISCLVEETGKLTFYNQEGKCLLEEYERSDLLNEVGRKKKYFSSGLAIAPRSYVPVRGTNYYKITSRFIGDEHQKLFGMGQYQQENLDLNGCKLELSHRNSQASVPFVISSKGYGMLWNNPAIGEVCFGKNRIEWTAYSTTQLDYWITAGDSPAMIEEQYACVTGRVPMMPEYAMGLWQCKLRYRTSEELLSVAREYKKRELPLSVIIADYFHWPNQGDYKFDPVLWPDVKAMTKELDEMGVKLIVSVWPTVEKSSCNYKEMLENGLLVRNDSGDRQIQLGDATTIDFTNDETKRYVWKKLKENYLDQGVYDLWLDEAEPEFNDYDYMNYRCHIGPVMETGNVYPVEYIKMAYEGMKEEGRTEQIHLIRCTWAGSQKYGALLWSGDIDSSFESLREQLAAGLNAGLAGIPWWTTDIGGFYGGDVRDEKFKECLVRWFQMAVFCPVLRMHGFRKPVVPPIGDSGGARMKSGSPNEIWSYGEEIYEILKKYLFLRESLKPYIKEIMKEAHEKGTPVMRPLFYDFPKDETCWELKDEYMFGPKYLVAPILEADMTERTVYLPEGVWRRLGQEQEYEGGKVYQAEAPLEDMPVFERVNIF